MDQMFLDRGLRNATLLFVLCPGLAHAGYIATDLGSLGGTFSLGVAINASGQVVGGSLSTGDVDLRAFLYSGSTMTDLGTLGGTSGAANAINASGQVVGFSSIAHGATHAFLYNGGVMSDLGTFGGTHSFAQGINNLRQVVGAAYTPGDVDARAFLSDNGGPMLDLGQSRHPSPYGASARSDWRSARDGGTTARRSEAADMPGRRSSFHDRDFLLSAALSTDRPTVDKAA